MNKYTKYLVLIVTFVSLLIFTDKVLGACEYDNCTYPSGDYFMDVGLWYCQGSCLWQPSDTPNPTSNPRTCCKKLTCDCDPGSGVCWVGSTWYSNCTDMCAGIGGHCPDTRPSCTPNCTVPPCPAGTSEGGSGSLERQECEDSCGDDHYRYCYYDCTEPTCSMLNPPVTELTWYESCPGGSRCQSRAVDIDIPSAPSGCPTSEPRTCYVENTPPEPPDPEDPTNDLKIEIVPGDFSFILQSKIRDIGNDLITGISNFFSKIFKTASAQEEQDVLGFTSTTHSGLELNNPLRLEIEFEDDDGWEDIQTLAVWWYNTTSPFVIPNEIVESGTPASRTTGSWGFLLRKGATGWNDSTVYVPKMDVNREWVPASCTSPRRRCAINSNTGNPIVYVYIPDGGVVEVSPNIVELTAYLEFNDVYKIGQFNTYQLHTNVTDRFSFLPLGGTEIYDRTYIDSGETWNVDLTLPDVSFDSISTVGENEISIDYSIFDVHSNLTYVAMYACRSDAQTTSPILGYDMPNCDSFSIDALDITQASSALLHVEPVATKNYDPVPINIDYTGNSGGSITFYILGMDSAGNYSYDTHTEHLSEWAITKGGFVFGQEGVSSLTRNIAENSWVNQYLKGDKYEFVETHADLTDIVLLGGHNSTVSFLGDLVKSSVNGAFKASNFPGVPLSDVYSELTLAYLNKKEEGYIEENVFDVDQTISQTCSSAEKEICSILVNGDVNINQNFNCDFNSLIVASGDINITPDFTSDPDKACILLAGGDINIRSGNKPRFTYDQVQAYTIANRQINILSDSNNNGLVVEGGLVAFTPSSNRAIANQRELTRDDRTIYPVLAVKGNSKYGILSRMLFGSQVDIFKLEVGFKPY